MQVINKERVAGLLQGLAQFGKTEHGITRLAYTAEDKAAQEWLLKQIQDLQLKLSVDAVGNVFCVVKVKILIWRLLPWVPTSILSCRAVPMMVL